MTDPKQQRIAIVTDSTCDLPADLREKWKITVVPLDVRFGNDVYQDGVDISPAEFMTRLVNDRVVPTTSQPPPGRFEEVFRKLAGDYDAIVAVLLSAKLSGTINSATTAAAAVADLVPVEIVDSRSGAMGLGFQAVQAAELAATGMPATEIASILRGETERCQVIFFVDTLDYIQRGGRIGRAAALIGSMLQLKPLLRVEDGQIVPWERTRTRARAIASLVEFAKGIAPVERIAALYSTDRNAGEALADRLASELAMPREQVLVCQIGATVASHIGPGAMGLAAIERGA